MNYMNRVKLLICIMIVVLLVATAGCNNFTRRLGGTIDIYLTPNTKLVNVTWKENSLWILTKPMRNDDVVETYEFKEDSNYGILEGTVKIYERKH